MLYLPTGIRNWFEKQALEHDTNLGSWLIQVVIDKAISEGFKCNHPISYQVVYKKTDGRNKAIWRCKNCGVKYTK